MCCLSTILHSGVEIDPPINQTHPDVRLGGDVISIFSRFLAVSHQIFLSDQAGPSRVVQETIQYPEEHLSKNALIASEIGLIPN